MGRYAKSVDIDIYFPAEYTNQALQALKTCASLHPGCPWSADLIEAKSLTDALRILYFKCAVTPAGAVIVENRADYRYPYRMDEYLNALAPFIYSNPVGGKKPVQNGYIVWEEETHRYWRDSFTGGKIKREFGSVSVRFSPHD